MFYFVRIYESFSSLLIIIEKCANESIPFLILIIFMLCGFAKIYLTLHTGINDPSDEYAGINSDLVKMVF
jgi:hypothetical protein